MRTYVAVLANRNGAGRYLESVDLFFAATKNEAGVCGGIEPPLSGSGSALPGISSC